ncbi:hypothetical protein Vretifemale_7274 [Volvox reticuliferus]|nr:hypothetical protein Vretifemale_7274 [Volvox reticuliferus]
MIALCWQLGILVLSLSIASDIAAATTAATTTNKSIPPASEGRGYDVIWAIGSRTSTDPYGNSTAAGSCQRLLGPPPPESFTRKICKAESTMSWMPLIKTPRYVDVRFDSIQAIVASAGLGLEIQILNLGTLRPVITAIDYILQVPGLPTAQSVPIYQAEKSDELSCPGINFFPIPPYALRPVDNLKFDDASVLGVRIHINDRAVERRLMLPSISAVGLRVRGE